jgi:uncharacterized membrane protein
MQSTYTKAGGTMTFWQAHRWQASPKQEQTAGTRIVALAIVAIIVAAVLLFGSANNAKPRQTWHTSNGTPCSQVHTAAFCAMEEKSGR